MSGIPFLILSHKRIFNFLQIFENFWEKPNFWEISRFSAGNEISVNFQKFQVGQGNWKMSGKAFLGLTLHVLFWELSKLLL